MFPFALLMNYYDKTLKTNEIKVECNKRNERKSEYNKIQ